MRRRTRAPQRPARAVRAKRPTPRPTLIDPQQLSLMADQALAGGVVQPDSIPELCVLLEILRSRGYELKRHTVWEESAAPWLFIVVPLPETAGVAVT